MAQRAVVAGGRGGHLTLGAVVAGVARCRLVGVGRPRAVVARRAGQAVGIVGVTWRQLTMLQNNQ